MNTVVGNGKRFIGYEIINRLIDRSENCFLQQLRADVKAKNKSRGKKHQLCQDSFDIKECRTEAFIPGTRIKETIR